MASDAKHKITVSTGKKHSFRLEETAVVFIAINSEESEEIQDDRFTLFSTDGGYKKTLTVKDDAVPGDDVLELHFKDVLRNRAYSLEVDSGAEGEVYLLFEDLAIEAFDLMKRVELVSSR